MLGMALHVGVPLSMYVLLYACIHVCMYACGWEGLSLKGEGPSNISGS